MEENRLRQAQAMDDMSLLSLSSHFHFLTPFLSLFHRSTALIQVGIKVIKKNPITVSSYLLGLLICLLFSGFALTIEQKLNFEKDLSKIDYQSLDRITTRYETLNEKYLQSKGFFSCDSICQINKKNMEDAKFVILHLYRLFQ